MRKFNFFRGHLLTDNRLFYATTFQSGSLVRNGEYWTNEEPEEITRQQRIEQQREQTNRMRNFGAFRGRGFTRLMGRR